MSTPSPAAEHRREAPKSLEVAVLTISDTRTMETDSSGALIVELMERAGHSVTRRAIVPDDPAAIAEFVQRVVDDDLDAAILTGGTGVSPRDRTPEAVAPLLTLPLPGFGELFRMLSHAEIGPACLLSRALGGIAGRTVVLALPGSRAAVELALTKIIVPELPHLVREARKV